MSGILITGGTGSFGRAFVRSLLDFPPLEIATMPWRVCVYSRGEHRQAEMRDELDKHPRANQVRWFIGDVRDQQRLTRAMEGCSIVVHAAALKRIEVGAYNPIEMVKTNVHGAINIVEAAMDVGAQRVVALSTDKAWQPVSPYGASKALAEAIFLSANNTRGHSGPTFHVTRYGNVAGSEGSVIPRWLALREAELVGTVTDPDCTRFYMTMAEAVQMVRRAAFAPTPPKMDAVIVPAELPAYRLGDLHAAIFEPQKAAVTGLPVWEKLHEGMADGYTSDRARRLSVGQLRTLIAQA